MDNTKAVQLTADEVKTVIETHARHIHANSQVSWDNIIERLHYLNKRLKDFSKPSANNEPEPSQEAKTSW